MNKYVGSDKSEEFYPHFLSNTQKQLEKEGHELCFVLFSDLLESNEMIKNKFVYKDQELLSKKKNDLDIEAVRIEKEYEFTFKQAYFSDIIQVYKGQNNRKITVPEKYFKDLSFLVPRFLFLEELIMSHDFDVIFSDTSPEVEMEFGRVIGNKLKKIVLKSGEGTALGKTIIRRSMGFGKDQLVEPDMNKFSLNEAASFCEDFKKYKKSPYSRPQKNISNIPFWIKILKKIKTKNFLSLVFWPLFFLRRNLMSLYFFAERTVLKPMIYDKYDPNSSYLFIGFHLNQESTMVLRAQPYTNQTVLVEMLSRTLPYNHILYVRAHPHWPNRYSYKYLSKLKEFPNVRLLSTKPSIHDIIKNSKGIITYNATTGIESLIYGKPVLSFASNIYKDHPAVDYCEDLFQLGSKLSQLVNRNVKNSDTISYISKINRISIDFLLGSSLFLSEQDSIDKAIIFSEFLNKSILWCNINNCYPNSRNFIK